MKGQRLSEEEALGRLNLSNLFSLWESVGQTNRSRSPLMDGYAVTVPFERVS